MEEKFVAGIDFGKAAREVVGWARLLKGIGFTPYFVNVIEEPIVPVFEKNELIGEILAKVKDERLKKLVEFTEGMGKCALLEGVPAVEILRYTKEVGAQMILVGSRGDAKTNLTGTTALKVARKSSVPVLVAKDGRRASFKRLLVYVDLSDSSKKALEMALFIASKTGVNPDVIFVLKNPYEAFIRAVSSDEKAQEVLEELERSSLEKLDRFLGEFKNYKLGDILIERGNPPEVIRDVVKSRRASLLFLGSEHMGGIQHFLLGSTAEKILRHPPTSLMVVKPEGFQFSLP